MTDNEIIKALECCINEDNDLMACGNKGCVFRECKIGKDRECHYYMMNSVLDLINRQKAEIESLGNSVRLQGEMLCEAKAEAIKEFAERLKEKMKTPVGTFYGMKVYNSENKDIDNLVKEMVGEDNA